MEIFLLYSILKLDAIHTSINTIFVVSIFVVLISIAAYYILEKYKVKNPEWEAWYSQGFSYRERNAEPEKYFSKHIWKHKEFKYSVYTILVALTFSTITPTTKEAAILIGGYYTVEVIKSEEGQKLIKVLRNQANEYLDEKLNKK